MTYKSYEARIQRIAAVTKGLRKCAKLVAALLLIAGLAAGGYLFAKGLVIGGVTCPPVMEYGDEVTPTSFVVMGSAVYEYTAEGGTEWSQTPPVLPGKYQVRAVTNRSFGQVSYSDPTPFIIQPRKVTVTVTEDSIPYGDTPTISVELMNGDRVEAVTLEFENLEISPNTPVHISKETIRIVNAKGEDVTSAYELYTKDKVVAVVPRPITLATESAQKVYDGTPLSAPAWSLQAGTLLEGDTLEVVLECRATYVTDGAVENAATTLAIKNAKGENMSAFYDVSTVWGTLTVTPAPLNAVTDGATVSFGDPIPRGQFSLVDSVLPEGHTYQSAPVEMVSKPGEYPNLWKLVVLNRENQDVTANFVVNEGREDHENWGNIEITARKIQLTTGSAKREYDGTPLFKVPENDQTETLVDSEADIRVLRAHEHRLVVVEYATLTVTGTVKNTLKVRIDDRHGVDITDDYYDIEYIEGDLTVEPMRLENVQTFSTPPQVPLIYNHQPQSYTEGIIDSFCLRNPSLPAGHSVELKSSTTVTDVTDGKGVENECEIRILNAAQEDVTDSFIFGYDFGYIQVAPLPIVLAPRDAEKYYDGTELSASTAIDVEGVLPEGYEIQAEFDGAILFGSGVSSIRQNADDSYCVTILRQEKDADGTTKTVDVSKNYAVSTAVGRLTVNPRPITIAPVYEEEESGDSLQTATLATTLSGSGTDRASEEAASDDVYLEKEYDGTPLEPVAAEIVDVDGSLGLPDGFKIVAVITGSRTLVGEGEISVIESYVIYDPDGNDVTRYFQVTSQTRKLRILPRKITLTTPDFTFSYNGKAQGMTAEALYEGIYEMLGEELANMADPHTFRVVSSPATITNVSESGMENRAEIQIYNSKGVEVTEYFDITCDFGTLTVTPLTVAITPGGWSKMYDGHPLYGSIQYRAVFSKDAEGLEPVQMPEFKIVLPDRENFVSVTEVNEGEVVNRFPATGYTITRNRVDESENFQIVVRENEDAILRITPRPVSLVIPSDTVIYNGQERSLQATASEDEGRRLVEYVKKEADGQYLIRHVLIPIKGQRDVTGDSPLAYGHEDYRVICYRYRVEGREECLLDETDVTDNYELSLATGSQPGLLTISPAPLYLILESYNGFYDGQSHTLGARLRSERDVFSYRFERDGQEYAVIPVLEGGVTVTLVQDSCMNTPDIYRIVGYLYKIDGDSHMADTAEAETLDLTANYDLQGMSQRVQVNPVPITVAPEDAQKVYDGLPLTSQVAVIREGSLVSGDQITIVTAGAPVNVDDPSVNTITGHQIFNRNGTDVTNCYDVTYATGSLTILHRELIMSTDDASRPFDGTPLTAESWTMPEVTLVEGHQLDVSNFASITDVGVIRNTCEWVIRDANGDSAVSRNYRVTVQYGTLEITQLQIYVYTDNDTKTYDGTPLSGRTELVHVIGLPPTLTPSLDGFQSITDVGNVENSCTVTLLFEGVEVDPRNYRVNEPESWGVLTVEQLKIQLSTLDDTKVYDGTPLSGCPDHVIVSNLPATLTLHAVDFKTITEVGTAENSCTVTLLYNGVEVNRDNYTVESTTWGTLSIQRRSVTVTTPDAGKVYDGTPLGTAPEDVIVEGLVPGHVTTVTCLVSDAVSVGSFENRWEINILDENGTDVTKQYEVNNRFGMLTILPCEITVTTASFTKEYDGQPLTFQSDGLTVYCPYDAWSVKLSEDDVASITKAGTIPNSCTVQVLDANGNEVTDYCDIVYQFGTLQVTPRRLTVTTPDFTKEYDGTPLQADSSTVEVSGLLEGDVFTAITNASITNVGSMVNTLDGWSVVRDGIDVSENYVVATNEGMLTVTAPPMPPSDPEDSDRLVIRPNEISVVYDGQPHGPTGEQFYIAEGSLPEGYTITDVQFTDMQWEVGSYESRILSLIIRNALGEDVTESEFSVELGVSTLHILHRPLNVSTDDASKTYDGTPLRGNVTITGLVEGHTVTILNETVLTNADTVKNACVVQVIDGEGRDVTNMYQVNYHYGQLTVTPVDMHVTTPTHEREYDGTLLAGKMHEVVIRVDGMPAGHHTVLTSAASITLPGRVPNQWTVTVLNESGVDVTENFKITETIGDLIVTPRSLAVTSGSYEKVYDGQPLTGDVAEFTFTEEKLLDGHVLLNTTSVTITEPGSITNAWTVTILDENGADVTEFYDITEVFGMLTVKRRNLAVTSGSYEKVYDGQPLTGSQEDVVVMEENLLVGHRFHLASDASITEPGIIRNIWTVTILDENGADVTHCYYIDDDFGTLTVNRRELTVSSKSHEKVYDGQPLTGSEEDFWINAGSLLEGHVYRVFDLVSVSGIGSVRNSGTIRIYDENDLDVTHLYLIHSAFGELTVENPDRIKLTIQPYEIKATYDGLPHGPADNSNEYWITEGCLPEGYTISEIYFTDPMINVGNYGTRVTSVVILNEEGEDVTDIEFDIEFRSAHLAILPIELEIETGSLRVLFDGKEHSNPTFKILGGTLLSGHTIEVVINTTVRNITAGRVVYNVVESFVIRDADGNVLLSGSSDDIAMQEGIDDDGNAYAYQVFGSDNQNYRLTIRYGTLKVAQK